MAVFTAVNTRHAGLPGVDLMGLRVATLLLCERRAAARVIIVVVVVVVSSS